MKHLLLAMVVLAAPMAPAQEVQVLELERLDMDYAKVVNNRDVYLPYEDVGRDRYETDETWRYGLGINFDLNLLRYKDYRFRWRNRIDGQATDTQFRAVAWDFRWGLKFQERFEIFYDHRSGHVMDAAPDQRRTYPLKNHYGLEITFYKRDSTAGN